MPRPMIDVELIALVLHDGMQLYQGNYLDPVSGRRCAIAELAHWAGVSDAQIATAQKSTTDAVSMQARWAMDDTLLDVYGICADDEARLGAANDDAFAGEIVSDVLMCARRIAVERSDLPYERPDLSARLAEMTS